MAKEFSVDVSEREEDAEEAEDAAFERDNGSLVLISGGGGEGGSSKVEGDRLMEKVDGYNQFLIGGFKYFFIFTPKTGEDSHFDYIIFFKWGWFNHQLVMIFQVPRGGNISWIETILG